MNKTVCILLKCVCARVFWLQAQVAVCWNVGLVPTAPAWMQTIWGNIIQYGYIILTEIILSELEYACMITLSYICI